jgi:hypothetical protein
MLKTKQKVKRQISDLKMDVEIVNPIESKTIMGGDWYDHDLGWLNITITNGGGTDFGTFWGNYNDGSTWGNQGGDYYGNGGPSDLFSHSLPDLPAVVPQQLNTLGSCVSYAVSFVSNYLGHETNPLKVAFNMDKILGLPSIMSATQIYSTSFNQGLTSPLQATQVINSYFNTNQITTIAQTNAAIDSNHPVIANYITEAASAANGNIATAHEVVIVEYNNLNYRVEDSLTGSYHWVPQSSITFGNGAYEITGIKP